ncbi:ABC transporter substrate-binding protein [Brucella sp. NBRC 113783]|uniref:ABC transporter substrate-binding protein n=2 Tax=Brucella sp. NBRC 113783 TaxID=3075478 RepID=UPI0026CFE5E4
MINRRTTLGMLASCFLPGVSRADPALPNYSLPQPGALPDLADRLPKTPRIVNMAALGRKPGVNGGVIRTLIGNQKDIRLMTLYGYSRLVGYDEKLNMHADILESFETVEDRAFTFKIRPGHRWSDGSYLTSEDFRYCWEDVMLNTELKRGGPPRVLLVNGRPPRFEVIDELTVRYSWDAPNPDFLPQLAAPQALTIVLPSQYLKQFHKTYQDNFRLSALMKQYRVKKWTDLHFNMARSYRPENPELPTLDPWRNTTASPAEQFVFERNPYFHRVDENGVQLPYVDKVILNISSPTIIAAKTGAGESDLQAHGIDFSDYAFLKDSEKRFPVRVSLWKRTEGARVSLMPNLNAGDAIWRALFWDVRVRRALSLAIDRTEINKAVFYGLAVDSANSILPESPLYKPGYKTAWSAHDPEQANVLLDAAGLQRRDENGIRLLPDGRSAKIVVETAGESTLETDILELVTDHWAKVGISLFIRTSQRDVFRSRAMGGEIMMSMWSGLDNGIPTADMNPGELAPTSDDQLQWPVWGMYYMSNGMKGHPPEIPEVKQLIELLSQWRDSSDIAERATIWTQMLDIYSQQVFSIGIVNSTPQPVLRAASLQNVPEKGLYGFDPTSFLGVFMPDAFWYGKDA